MKNRKERLLCIFLLCVLLLLITVSIILAARTDKKGEFSKEIMQDNMQEEQESKTGEGLQTDKEQENTDENGQSEPEPEREEASEPEEERQAVVLDSLKDCIPGQILDETQIDIQNPDAYFTAGEILPGDEIYDRIMGRSYQENPDVSLSDLVYVKLLHYNFEDRIQVGELIVNKKLEEDVLNIFKELFENRYQIASMHLVDDYWNGNGEDADTASIDANNTSAFNYRPVSGGKKLSRHAYGCAIDINPQQNPYVIYTNGRPSKWYHENAGEYVDRTSVKDHMITHEDLCYKIFIKYGFTWGGDWNSPRDYQHFEIR